MRERVDDDDGEDNDEEGPTNIECDRPAAASGGRQLLKLQQRQVRAVGWLGYAPEEGDDTDDIRRQWEGRQAENISYPCVQIALWSFACCRFVGCIFVGLGLSVALAQILLWLDSCLTMFCCS